MSAREVPMYAIFCDWPDCGKNAHDDEGDDYSGYESVESARTMASEADWWIGLDGKDYCTRHRMFWASERELDEPFPEPPFLLIHSGDTSDPINDDGKVTLVLSLNQAAVQP